MATYVVSVMSTITAMGAVAGVGYLRGISKRMAALHEHARDTDLHILDLYQRTGPHLEPRRVTR